MARRRADQLLVERGLAESRTKAQSLIMAGLVTASGRRIDKPGAALAEDAELAVAGPDHPWVSRGGLKLAFALEHFAIDPGGAPGVPRSRVVGSGGGRRLEVGGPVAADEQPQDERHDYGVGDVVEEPDRQHTEDHRSGRRPEPDVLMEQIEHDHEPDGP